MSKPTCPIKQPHCGHVGANPVCPKCGIDNRFRYLTEEARLLVIANDAYWQAHANSLEEMSPVAATPEPPQPPELPPQLGTSKSVMGWLVAVLALLGSASVAGQYLANKQAASPAEVTRAPAATPLPKRCTDCPEMVIVPGGSFQMGTKDADTNEKPVHSVSIKSFAIGKYEVTQGQWRAIMGNNPSGFANCGDNCPVENVSWDDIQSYVQKLNQKTGQQYRLPSEAEWEYACRGGQQHKYCGSNAVGRVAWYLDNSARTTHPVGQKAPNEFGLYDMSGNVGEWVQDQYNNSYKGAPTDGTAWKTGSVVRMLRGGSWTDHPFNQRSAYRFSNSPGGRSSFDGFRLARTAL